MFHASARPAQRNERTATSLWLGESGIRIKTTQAANRMSSTSDTFPRSTRRGMRDRPAEIGSSETVCVTGSHPDSQSLSVRAVPEDGKSVQARTKRKRKVAHRRGQRNSD